MITIQVKTSCVPSSLSYYPFFTEQERDYIEMYDLAETALSWQTRLSGTLSYYDNLLCAKPKLLAKLQQVM